MAIYVRPFVTSIAHVEGCPKRNCGPLRRARRAAGSTTSSWSCRPGAFLRGAEEVARERQVQHAAIRQKSGRRTRSARASPRSRGVTKEVLTVSGFEEQFMTFSRTNNKPSTVSAKEGMLRVHLLPFFGSMKLDAIGPAEVEAYKARSSTRSIEKKTHQQPPHGAPEAAEPRRGVGGPRACAEGARLQREAAVRLRGRVPHVRGGGPPRPGRRARVADLPRRGAQDRPPRRRAPRAQVAGPRPRRRHTSSSAGRSGATRRVRPRAAGTGRCRSRTRRSRR